MDLNSTGNHIFGLFLYFAFFFSDKSTSSQYARCECSQAALVSRIHTWIFNPLTRSDTVTNSSWCCRIRQWNKKATAKDSKHTKNMWNKIIIHLSCVCVCVCVWLFNVCTFVSASRKNNNSSSSTHKKMDRQCHAECLMKQCVHVFRVALMRPMLISGPAAAGQ